MLNEIFFLNLVVDLSDYFSKEISRDLVFKFKKKEQVKIKNLQWKDEGKSYIQLFSCDNDKRAAVLFSYSFLVQFSSLMLGHNQFNALPSKSFLTESFVGWLINKRMILFFEQQKMILKKTSLVSSSRHLFNFSDSESLESVTIQVLNGQKIMGDFLFLTSLDTVEGAVLK